MQVLLGYFVTPPLESLGAGYKTGNKLFLVPWGPLNTSRPIACFQHELPMGVHMLLDYMGKYDSPENATNGG